MTSEQLRACGFLTGEYLVTGLNRKALYALCAVQEAQKKLKETDILTTEKEEHFEKELAIAQKLARLHKSHCEKRTAEAVQLESIVRDLRRHVEVSHPAHYHVFALSKPRQRPLKKAMCHLNTAKLQMTACLPLISTEITIVSSSSSSSLCLSSS